ncbi:MAG: hypothetical protein ACR2GA_00855, partial [Chloroflexota bacterium]
MSFMHRHSSPDTRHIRLPSALLRLAAMPALVLAWGIGTGVTHASGSAPTKPSAPAINRAQAAPNLKPAANAAPLSTTPSSTNTFAVTNTGDAPCAQDGSGGVSRRCAITLANNSPATYAKVISFAIPSSDPGCALQSINSTGAEVCTIAPAGDLPPINSSFVTVNGYAQPGAHANTSATAENATLTIQVDGSSYLNDASGSGLQMLGNGDLVEGLSLINFHDFSGTGVGIAMSGNGDKATGDFLGVASRGIAAGNDHGISVGPFGATAADVIGGTIAATRNVISANSFDGAYVASNGNTIEGNLLGTSPSGTVAMGNGGPNVGLSAASGNTIGGTTTGARNVISGDAGAGVSLYLSTGNTIEGNYIGTDVTGAKALGNNLGVYANQSSGNTIGGSSSSARNVISGNSSGVYDLSGGNSIANNYIGMSASKRSLPNTADGVDLATNGATASGNLIADSAGAGVAVFSGDAGNVISRNSMYGNGNLGINFQGEAPATCATGVSSDQANDYFDCPVLSSVTATTISGTAPAGSTVEVFLAQADANDQGHGEGQANLGSTTATSS